MVHGDRSKLVSINIVVLDIRHISSKSQKRINPVKNNLYFRTEKSHSAKKSEIKNKTFFFFGHQKMLKFPTELVESFQSVMVL